MVVTLDVAFSGPDDGPGDSAKSTAGGAEGSREGLAKEHITPCLSQFWQLGLFSSHYEAMSLAFKPPLGSRTLTFRFLHCTQPARDFRWERRPGGYVAMSTALHELGLGIVYPKYHLGI